MIEGLVADLKVVTRQAYHIKICIPKLLFDFGLTKFKEQTILIQVDTISQKFKYKVERRVLNKFEVFTQINLVPKELLLSQKIFASVNRKRLMGRDFFDIVFLYGIGAKPNMEYLDINLGIRTEKELKNYYLSKISTLNFIALSKDLEPLLFNKRDVNKVLLFKEFAESNF